VESPIELQADKMASLESILRGVFQLLDQESSFYTRAPNLAQQISSFTFREHVSEELRIALNGLSAALTNANCIGDPPAPADHKKIRDAIGLEYERVLFLLRSDANLAALGSSLPTLRPTNYTRNFFHIFNALFGVCMYEFFLTYEQCILVMFGFLLWYVAMDVLRRMFPSIQTALFDRLFNAITRPRERFIIPAATWYCISMATVVILSRKTIAQVAVMVLGVGDPAATLIGRTFKSRKLLGQKSVAGFLGFVSISAGMVLLFLLARRPDMGMGEVLALALVAGVVGALAELFGNDRIDDNLTIPLAVAIVTSILF
jgi:dolichol kinase